MGGALAAGAGLQYVPRGSDPPGQTDRVFTYGWPTVSRFTGGIGGRERWDRGALAFNLGALAAAGAVTGAIWPRRRTR